MIHLDVAFTPGARTDDVAIVVDVLRMTTTAASLFARGLAELTVIADEAAAREHAVATGAMLRGERGGVALPGFDGGNSPLEQTDVDLAGRCAILCTTNGSKAVEGVADARHVLLGAIVNAHAVAAQAGRLARSKILVACAGTDGRVSIDDVAGAGRIAWALIDATDRIEASDAAQVAMRVATHPDGLEAVVRSSRHAKGLAGMGFDADIAYAARPDVIQQVPALHERDPSRFVAARDRP